MFCIGTQEQCQAYDAKVTLAQGYNGTTTRWATPTAHPTNGTYAIVAFDGIEPDDEMLVVQVLDETWTAHEVV